MKLHVKNLYTYIEFEEGDSYLKDIILKRMHTTLGARQEGFQYSPAYKRGQWDGYIDFYEYDRDRFPTGLLFKVQELLGELQSRYNFQYGITDERDESFLAEEDIDKEINLLDDNVGQITLRDYQYDAVFNSLTYFNGILHISTNGGKCISKDSVILTTEGYKTLEEIFNEKGISLDNKEEVVPIKYPLINRYGEVEYTSYFTKNGLRKTKKIKTDRGIEVVNTYNHPLLVREGHNFVWKNTEDIKEGDILVSRKGDNQFGTDKTIVSTEEAYVLGCMIADSYMGVDHRLSFSNDKEELLKAVSDYWSTISSKETYYDTHKKSKGITIHLHDKKATKDFYNKYDIELGVAKDKKVPKCILKSPKDIQLSFLSGYLECESSIREDGRDMEVTSASRELLKQIQLMLFNLGVDNSLTQKTVKGYEQNYYGRLRVKTRELKYLLSMLEFKTEQRKKQKGNILDKEYKSQYGNKIEGFRDTLKNYRNSLHINKKEFSKYIQRDSISIDRLRKILELYPGGEGENTLKRLADINVVYQKVESVEEGEVIPTFDVCMPKTHSFISNSIVNHNTEIASGIIDQLLPQLERGERIAFFTGSTEIFHQSADRLKQRLNIPVGKVGAGQFNIQQVTVVMVPTLNANLKDPTQGVKLTPKQNISKKIATEFLPKFEGGTNQKKLLGMLLDNFIPKTKVEQTVKDELIGIYKSCKNDNEVLMRLKNHNANFQNIVRNKNKKKYDKYHRMREFLDTITVMIVDEAHHSKSDTWYNNLMTCENALYRIALTGSIDKKDELLWMRMQGLFGDVISRVTNKQLIEEGHSAKPTINIIPIANPNDIDNIDEYRVAYEKGIINNNFRNKLIAKLTEKWYNEDKGILIIVNFIDHGNNISELLDGLNVEHYFLHGEVDSEIRKQKLNDMRSGKLKVMIATSLIDEGVDISGINSLILGAGGKSLRQVLQRVGRALRKKKDDNTTQIYDFADMTNRFLFHHSKEREKIYKEEEFEIRKM
ncbi:DNA helicase [Staphylococcus phage 80A]|uniref:DNA helicase n=2 Tax=unclassified Sepunavirus TaxID=2315193 RepID=A0AAX3Y3W0_9CAUD|nr:DNA helicase [Staphylococcus phage 80A]WJJ58020.1 DNA helicase [Staphylococcus phage 80B]